MKIKCIPSVDKDQKLIISVFEDDPEFEKQIISIRRKFGIPPNGYPHQITNTDIPADLEKIFDGKIEVYNKIPENIKDGLDLLGIKNDHDLFLHSESKMLCHKYNLPEYCLMSFACFIAFNFFPEMIELPNISYYGKTSNNRWHVEGGENVLISIEKQVKKDEIIRWIRENWGNGLSYEVSRLPTQPKSRIKNLNLLKKIAANKKKFKKDAEVAKIMSDNSPNRSYSDQEINVFSKRFDKYVSARKSKAKPRSF
jgi:hypothetical protein